MMTNILHGEQLLPHLQSTYLVAPHARAQSNSFSEVINTAIQVIVITKYVFYCCLERG